MERETHLLHRIWMLHTILVSITIIIGAIWYYYATTHWIYNILLLPVIAGIIGINKSTKVFGELIEESKDTEKEYEDNA